MSTGDATVPTVSETAEARPPAGRCVKAQSRRSGCRTIGVPPAKSSTSRYLPATPASETTGGSAPRLVFRPDVTVRDVIDEIGAVVGADETFFEDDPDTRPLIDLYNEKSGELDGEVGSEVDPPRTPISFIDELLSTCYSVRDFRHCSNRIPGCDKAATVRSMRRLHCFGPPAVRHPAASGAASRSHKEDTMTRQTDGSFGNIRRRFDRRQILKGAAAGVGAVAVGASFGRPGHAAAQGVTIKVLVPQGALADGLTKTAPAFESETGNKIAVEAFPYATLQEKAVTLTQAKSDAYDLFFVDDPWMPNLQPANSAVAIDKEYGYKRDPDIFPVCYDVFSWPPPYGPVSKSVRDQNLEPHLYGLPVVGNVILYAIREDVLKAKGLSIPETWDDALNIAKAVYDPKKPFYGWDARQAGGNVDSIPLLWSLGGDILDDNFNVVLDSAAGLQTFKLLKEMAKYGPQGLVSYQTNEFASDFLAGRAMMGMTWPGDTLVSMEDPAQSQSAGKLHYMNSPAGKAGSKGASVLGNWGLILNAASKHRDEAYKFMTWITSQEHSLEYAKNGGVPFRKSNLNNPELVAKFPWYPAQAEALAAPPKWRPRTAAGSEILDIYGSAVQLMITGDKSPEDVLAQATKDIKAFMETAVN